MSKTDDKPKEEKPKDEPKAKGKQKQGEYNANQLKELSDLEHVRQRPGMYIGDTTGHSGYHHLLWEVVDNSVDEALAGYGKTIVIRLHPDHSVSVVDEGRGIPTDVNTTTGKTGVEMALGSLRSGGKFDKQNYDVSGGLHGVGVSVTNYLSEWTECEVHRGGKIHTIRYERGVPQSKLVLAGETDRTGTRVRFKPDPQIFKEGTPEFHLPLIVERVRQLAFLNDGIGFKVVDERGEEPVEETFRYDGGLKAFVKFLNENKETLFNEPTYLHKEQVNDKNITEVVEVCFQYNDGYSENLLAFTNNIFNAKGGSHVKGFKSALTRTLNNYGKKEGLLKKGNLQGDDFREGLAAIISVKVAEPRFTSQNKENLEQTEVERLVEAAVAEQLGIFLEENPKAAKAIVNKAVMASQVREAVRKTREAQRKGVFSGGSLPGKLWDCSNKDTEETELYLVEGDSAGGSAKGGRDRRYQAILPLKGKILNVEKAHLAKMLQHEEIATIIQAIGCGFGTEEFDLAKCRYGKIIIMTDADVDGSHIRTLLLTFFYRQMPQLIENGRIYVAFPPLYHVKRKSKAEYVLSDKELNASLLKLGVTGVALSVKQGKKVNTIEGKELDAFLKVLSRLEEHQVAIGRKGISIAKYFSHRDPETGLLPACAMWYQGELTYYKDMDAAAKVAAKIEADHVKKGLPFKAYDEEDSLKKATDGVYVLEIPQAGELELILREIEEAGVSIAGFYDDPLPDQETPDRAVATLSVDGGDKPIYAMHRVLSAVRGFGRQGIEIKRFKGLGEMNSEELWETTMDPVKRTLKRVSLEDAVKTDRIFTVLMGNAVEPRREFIEKHALEVKNLDI